MSSIIPKPVPHYISILSATFLVHLIISPCESATTSKQTLNDLIARMARVEALLQGTGPEPEQKDKAQPYPGEPPRDHGDYRRKYGMSPTPRPETSPAVPTPGTPQTPPPSQPGVTLIPEASMPQALPTESPTRTEPPTLPGPQAEAPPAALEDPANSDAQQAAGAVRELKAELRAKAEAPVDENFELINKAFTAIAETQPLGDRVTQILVITNAEARVGLGNLAGLPPGNPDEQIIRTTVAALARLLPNLVQTLGTAGTLIEMIQQMADRMHGLDVVMRQRPHNVPLTQAEAQGILPDLLWAQMQTDELHSDLVQRIAATAAKTLYDGRPRIPSYFIYAVLNAAVNELRPLIEPIEQGLKEFTRHLETITKWLQDRAADIERRMNSPDTSQTDKGYLAGHLRMITELRETIIAQLKEVNELGATAPALIRAVIKPISTLLADPKRLEIFNQVSEARK